MERYVISTYVSIDLWVIKLYFHVINYIPIYFISCQRGRTINNFPCSTSLWLLTAARYALVSCTYFGLLSRISMCIGDNFSLFYVHFL